MQILRFDACPYIPASHEEVAAPGVWKKVLCRRPDLQDGRVQIVNWARMPAESAFRHHYHEDMQELFIIVRGRARITAGTETAELAPGDAVTIPAGEEHAMEALGQEDLEYIAVGVGPGAGKTVVT